MIESLATDLRKALGAEHVLDDPAACAEAASDLFPATDAVPASLVIRPKDTAEAAEALRLLAAAGAGVVPRGAGLSYTGGVAPTVEAVVLDTGRMTDIRIDSANLVAVVGAGVSWQVLHEALEKHALTVAQITPISGQYSTVGGLAAQSIPGGTDGFLGLTVVLADGSVVQTGALAVTGAPPFWRALGPDLTGLFLGDCGAFGVKTEIAVRLKAKQPAAFGSFAFDDSGPMMEVLTEILRQGLPVKAMAMDPVRAKSATKVDAGEALKTAGAVLRNAGGVLKAARDMAQLARGATQLQEPAWTLHVTGHGPTSAAAEACIEVVRGLVKVKGGREIDPAIPKALHARPYSIRGFVGPEGERWVPVHGILSLGSAKACLAALGERIAALKPDLDVEGISVSHIIGSAGPYVTIEPMFYWSDELDPLHMRYLSERNRDRFGGAALRPQAREAVRKARAELGGVLDANGAFHAQIGRYYALQSRLTGGGVDILNRIKAALDPSKRMNPGVMGL